MNSPHYSLTLTGDLLPSRELVGGKAWSLVRMSSLGLPVPPAFVMTTDAFRAYQRDGGLSQAVLEELHDRMVALECATGRSFGAAERPLLVSVRSGSSISMPGMMDTVLNLGMHAAVEDALGRESGDPRFAKDTHRRFLELYSDIVLKTPTSLPKDGTVVEWRQTLAAAGAEVPEDPHEQLHEAVAAVFESWNSRRARRYREHHGIDHDLGTAVTIQAMVFGNLDDESGTGVLFSRNPLTGERRIFGEYLRRAQGEDIVSGQSTPEPLDVLAAQAPALYQQLADATETLEVAAGEVQDIEFTVQEGRLYLLQSRAAKLAPAAAIQTAIDFVAEGVIDEVAGLRRVRPDDVRSVLAPRLSLDSSEVAIATGESACPGVGIGVVVTDPDEAERRGALGEQVILARDTTSPNDLHGMLASVAIITEEGGSTSHAAVVSRGLGLPCVVGCGAGSVTGLEGQTVTVDGGSGRVYAGSLPIEVPDESSLQELSTLTDWATRHSPIDVLANGEGLSSVLDLNFVEGGADVATVVSVLLEHGAGRAVTGGAIATPEAVKAAIDVGCRAIIARPALPVLLTAALIHVRRSPRKENA